MVIQHSQKLEINNTQKPDKSQALTHKHSLCQVNQMNQVSLQVNHQSPSAPAQMTQRQIQIPHLVTTSNPTTSQTSTDIHRTLRPRIPISYNETLLTRLHRRPQIRTINNLSIPLPDSSNEETEDTEEHTQEDTHEDTNTNATSKCAV